MKRAASTLIEILFYFTILAVFLFTAVFFAIQILNVSQLTTNRHELELGGEFITNQITTAIQSADSVDSAASLFDNDAGMLTLNMTEAANTPTVFSVVNGDLFFQEGSQASVTLNSPFVQVDSVRFHHITSEKTPDQIIVDMSLSSISDIPNTQVDLSFHFTVSLRP